MLTDTRRRLQKQFGQTIMDTPVDNAYIGVTTSRFREAADFYIQHFSYSVVTDHGNFVSVMAPNGKRCIGFSASQDIDTPSRGVSLTFLVDDASIALQHFKDSDITITRDIGVGVWGVPHFIVTDPAGIELYISERAHMNKQAAAANP